VSSSAAPAGPVNSWLLPRAVLTSPVGGRAALVVPAGDDPATGEERAARLAARAAQTLLAQHPAGVDAGVSGVVGAGGAHLGWRQADAGLRAARLARQDGRGDQGEVEVRAWSALGAHRLLALADAEGLRAAVVDGRARRLLEGDPELLRTARAYLDLAGSARRTAASLAIHRQTLYHRLRRIADVSGYDLDDGRDRLALHLALTLG
jgi:DNA-binding PucR family transcriptional regulator